MSQSGEPDRGPRLPAPRTAYGADAGLYEARTRAFARYRRGAVGRLPLRQGDVVLDVGCGTGLCFRLLLDRIGPEGTVVGVDASGPMLTIAAERAAASKWRNVQLVHAEVDRAPLPDVDHALFCAVHDILQSPAALDHVLAHVRPGGGVSATGGKWAPAWAVPVNVAVLSAHAPFVDSFSGFDRPWALLAERVPDLDVATLAWGGGFLAWGTLPGA
jgi:demethylmenaquinone methyltransferase/2-methoxy-6-polyprenyl-1,4-benzoquinol methylase